MSTQQLVHGTTAKRCGGLPFTSPEYHEALFHLQDTANVKGWVGHGAWADFFRCGTCPCAYLYVWSGLYLFFLIGSDPHIPSDMWQILHGQKRGFLRGDHSSTEYVCPAHQILVRGLFIMVVFGFYICILRSLCLFIIVSINQAWFQLKKMGEVGFHMFVCF